MVVVALVVLLCLVCGGPTVDAFIRHAHQRWFCSGDTVASSAALLRFSPFDGALLDGALAITWVLGQRKEKSNLDSLVERTSGLEASLNSSLAAISSLDLRGAVSQYKTLYDEKSLEIDLLIEQGREQDSTEATLLSTVEKAQRKAAFEMPCQTTEIETKAQTQAKAQPQTQPQILPQTQTQTQMQTQPQIRPQPQMQIQGREVSCCC